MLPRRPFAALLVAVALVLALTLAPAHAGMFVEFPALPWAPVGTQLEGNFGESVAPAGDVDGDGYGDVVVGANLEDGAFMNEGGAYLFRGSPDGTRTTHAWLWRPGQADAGGGEKVAPAGDVNADGYADVLVSVPSWNTPAQMNAGKVAVFHGGPNGLTSSPAYELFSPIIEANQQFGRAIAPAGDVNGDGYDDVVVGVPFNSVIGFTNRGAAYVFHGGPTGLALAPARTWFGGTAEGHFGASVSGAGDVNGDSFADVIVGAPLQLAGNGSAHLFLGSPAGVPAAADTVILGLPGAQLGSSVSLAGDVNGDDYGDVLIGSPNLNALTGRVDLAYGGPGGIASSTELSIPFPAEVELAGRHVATAGDLDGDGLADFLVVAGDIPNGGRGRVIVYRGGRTQPTWIGDINSPFPNDGFFGSSVGTAGDANGDGLAEILIGSEDIGAPPAGQDAGRAFQYGIPRVQPGLHFGWPVLGLQAGTRFGNSVAILQARTSSQNVRLLIGESMGANGNGSVWLYEATPTTGAQDAFESAYSGALNGGQMGTRVVDLGDVNRDGFGDFATSSPIADHLGVLQAGRVDWFAGGSPPQNAALVLGGAHEFDRIGGALAGRGDVNGDGYHDILIGAREWDSNGIENRGAAWVVLGGPGGPAASPAWTREGGEAGAGLGAGVAFADFDADGYTDVAVGSTPVAPSSATKGRVEVFYGSPGGVATNPGLVILPLASSGLTFGGTVAALGDVTGDGVCDLGVGSPGENGNRGRVDVYRGTLGRSQSNAWIRNFMGTIVDGRLGAAIEGGGDVDGDGFGDFAIGEPGWSNGQTAEGRVLLLRGAPNAPESTPWTYESDIVGAQFGAAIAPLRDLNRDGLADLVVGAPSAAGRTYVFHSHGLGAQRNFQVLEPGGAIRRLAPARLTATDNLAFLLTIQGTGGGRARVGHDFEIRPQTEAFTGVPTHLGANNTFDTGPPVSTNESFPLISHPYGGSAWHVRARLRSRSPFFPRSIWLTPEGHMSGLSDAWLSGTTVDASPVGGAAGRPRVVAVSPNPAGAGGESRIAFTLPRAARVTLDLYDVRGARVRRLLSGEERPAGASTPVWDGRDDRGRAAPAGLYFVHLSVDGQEDRARLVRLP